MPSRREAKVNFTPPKRTSRLRISTLCLFSACIKKTIAVLVCKVTNFFGHTQKKIAKFLRNGVFFCRLSRAFGPRIAMVDTLFYGRSDAPHCSFRSNCQFKAILHAKSTGDRCLRFKEFYVLGVPHSEHSRAALTPHTCHRQLFGAAQSLHPPQQVASGAPKQTQMQKIQLFIINYS